MNSLKTRILVVIAGFGLLTAVALTGIMYASVRSYYVNVQYDTAREFAHHLAELNPDLPQRIRKDARAVGDLLSQYVLLSPKTGLYLLDDEGRVLASSGEGRIFWSNYKVDIAKVKRSLELDPTVPIYSDDPDGLNKGCIVAAHPMKTDGMTTWVYVVARSADFSSAAPELLKNYAIRVAVKVGLVTLALGILLTLLMMTVLTRPLTTLTRAVQTVHDNEDNAAALSMELPFSGRTDEIGKLSNAFQALVTRLKQEVTRVTQGDAQRREMIASVSHDVRTPLTALIAQLETIRMKREQLTAQEQAKLFDQAAGNTQHLKRLTDSLAELGYLDSPEVKAVLEPMPLCELTDDIVQRFKPRADASGFDLSIDYDEKLPRVPIDAGLFDRALSNLVDNAFRYSPVGGKIEVTVRAVAQNSVRVSVADQGPGVPESEQKRIFERFYQSSEHRSMRGSSGLGLAIVQRVVELHKGHAGVNSKLGQGAQFWMSFSANEPILL